MDARREDGYTISTDPEQVDLDVVWGFLRTSYWSPGIDRETVARGVAASIVFSVLDPDGAQAGFARVVTDHTRFAWLADVFVLETHRGRGLGVWLVETVLSHPDLANIRMLLGTADAQGLYARFGFRAVDAERIMERPRRGERVQTADLELS
jgi:GNAT superfamily N-acetyltransferase